MSTGRRRDRGNGGISIPVVALACLLGGCAARSAPAPKTAGDGGASARPVVRMAWLPVESLASPEIAEVVNDTLARLKVAGATETVRAPVSMEVAQLTIECIRPTVACYRAVGESFHVDRLLWVEMASRGADAKGLRVTLGLFDVAEASYVRREEWTFPSVAEARPALAGLIERALAGGKAGSKIGSTTGSETRSGAAATVATRTPTP